MFIYKMSIYEMSMYEMSIYEMAFNEMYQSPKYNPLFIFPQNIALSLIRHSTGISRKLSSSNPFFNSVLKSLKVKKNLII